MLGAFFVIGPGSPRVELAIRVAAAESIAGKGSQVAHTRLVVCILLINDRLCIVADFSRVKHRLIQLYGCRCASCSLDDDDIA